MADDAREAGQITGLCSALVLNMGTLNERTVQAMLHAGQTANLLGRPVVFDPVGAGASDFRNDTALRLLREIRCAAIKGNNSEISFLAGGMADARGVDAGPESLVTEDNLAENARRARKVAALTGAVIMVSGPIDIVADSREAWAVRNLPCGPASAPWPPWASAASWPMKNCGPWTGAPALTGSSCWTP